MDCKHKYDLVMQELLYVYDKSHYRGEKPYYWRDLKWALIKKLEFEGSNYCCHLCDKGYNSDDSIWDAL